MGWFKLSDRLTEDLAIRKLDAEGFRLYTSILCILRHQEYVAGDIEVPIETLMYHSCLQKPSIMVRIRVITGLGLGVAEYLKRSKTVRLNFPNWLEHQWEWIRKIRNFDGMKKEDVRNRYGNATPKKKERKIKRALTRAKEVKPPEFKKEKKTEEQENPVLRELENPLGIETPALEEGELSQVRLG